MSAAVAHVHRRRVEPADNGSAAEIGGCETNALLLREADHLDGKRQARAAQAFQYNEGAKDAKASVILPGIAHRVIVRSEDQRSRPGTCARPPPHDVADGIDFAGKPRCRKPVA